MINLGLSGLVTQIHPLFGKEGGGVVALSDTSRIAPSF